MDIAFIAYALDDCISNAGEASNVGFCRSQAYKLTKKLMCYMKRQDNGS